MSSNYITVDIGHVDVYYEQVAEQLVSDCDEDEFLRELACHVRKVGSQSKDEVEKQFCAEATTRLFELADWFKKNTPGV